MERKLRPQSNLKWRVSVNSCKSFDATVKHHKTAIDMQECYENEVETKPVLLENECKILFPQEFNYLGSLINFELTDTSDIKVRIAKASKAKGDLAFFWKLLMVESHTKCLL